MTKLPTPFGLASLTSLFRTFLADPIIAASLTLLVAQMTSVAQQTNGLTITSLSSDMETLTITWINGTPPYYVQRLYNVEDTNWFTVLKTTDLSAVLDLDPAIDTAYYRIRSNEAQRNGDLVILDEPQSQFVEVGSQVTFSVVAAHDPPSTNAITYQWKKNGVVIVGATDTSYAINDVQFTDVAAYTVHVTGTDIESQPAFLSASLTSGNGGTLAQTIGGFGAGNPLCSSGFTFAKSFYPTNAMPYGYVPPMNMKLSVDTFHTGNGTNDTAVEIWERPGLSLRCCNDNAGIVFNGNSKLSQCTNITVTTPKNYRFGLYVKPTPPPGFIFYLNYLFYQ